MLTNRARSGIWPTHRRRCDAGTAFMEFFFALPFLLFIMILALNFCKAYLTQQRCMVAARYVAWADVQHQPRPSNGQISSSFFGGAAVQVNSPMSIGASQAGWTSGAMSDISHTQHYTVQYHYVPVFAAGNYFGNGNYNWYPDVQMYGSISVDSQDWRYPTLSDRKS